MNTTRLHRLRALKGWSQSEMAAYLGLSQSQVSRLETGFSELSGPGARLLDMLETQTEAAGPVLSTLETADGVLPARAAE